MRDFINKHPRLVDFTVIGVLVFFAYHMIYHFIWWTVRVNP